VSGPPRFVTLIACQGRSERRRVIECRIPRRYAGRAGEGRGKQTRGRLNWRPAESHSAPLSRQNRLRLISDAWIRISKGWKTNTNSNLKFKVRKSELRLATLVGSLQFEFRQSELQSGSNATVCYHHHTSTTGTHSSSKCIYQPRTPSLILTLNDIITLKLTDILIHKLYQSKQHSQSATIFWVSNSDCSSGCRNCKQFCAGIEVQ